jgi:glutamate racemase
LQENLSRQNVIFSDNLKSIEERLLKIEEKQQENNEQLINFEEKLAEEPSNTQQPLDNSNHQSPPLKRQKFECNYLTIYPILSQKIHRKIKNNLTWKNSGEIINNDFVYDLNETPASNKNKTITLNYIKFFMEGYRSSSAISKNPSVLLI